MTPGLRALEPEKQREILKSFWKQEQRMLNNQELRLRASQGLIGDKSKVEGFKINWAAADVLKKRIKHIEDIESVEQIKEHGQTLKGATKSGLYDKWGVMFDSEIDKKALQEGVKSGLVQKEMLDAILADKDLSKEDTAFMKTLVEQATKKHSLYVADLGLHERLDKIFPVNAPTGGGIIAAQSMLQSRKSLQSQGQSTVAPVSVINQNNQSSVTVADSRSLISSKRQAAYSMAGMCA